MNINNVVLVRAMNNLPLNGELIPSCEGQRLVVDNQSDFSYFMRACVRTYLEQKLGRELVLFIDSPDAQLLESTMQDYSIVTGDYYTTTLSFALNGLVPDDINNQFSTMKMAILEPLKNQIHSNFVTIETIDTTIKGRMKTSAEAILVIEREYFSQLPQVEQVNLTKNYSVKMFDGNLKDAISNTLIENGYPALPLIQKKEMANIDDCPEKQSMLAFEDKFSASVGASRLRLQYLTYMYGGGTEVDRIAHDKIEEEHTNTLIVQEYYKNQLYSFLLNKAQSFGIKVSEEDKYYLFTSYDEGTEVMKRIVRSLIETHGGLENFKQFIQEYNNYVNENYLTNQQIVSSVNNKQKN